MAEAAATGTDPLLGRVLDRRYRVEAVIGTGGIGTVYRAIHLKLDRPVAVKVLRPEFAKIEELVARFDREARVLSRLDHVNIVTITDFGVADGFAYLVMELLSGRSLEAVVEGGPLSLGRVVTIARQILATLAYAHGLGVVHRDLKPQNVVLVEQPGIADLVKILDFGLAKLAGPGDGRPGADPTLTKHGMVFGTPAYMSPEQAQGETADARSDLYGVGVLLFELLAGRPPFEGTSTAELLRHHIVTRPPRLADVAPPGVAIPDLFERFCARALQKERRARFQSAERMLEALEEAAQASAAHEPGPARVFGGAADRSPRLEARTVPALPSGLAARGRAWWRRWASLVRETDLRSRWIVLVAVGFVLLLVLAWSIARATRDPPPPPVARIVPRGLPAAVAPPVAPRPTASEPAPSMAPDPWVAPDVPRALRVSLARIESGALAEAERTAKAYVKQHRDDPLGHLALGHGYCARGWRRDGLLRYRIALRLDRSMRGDPRMLANLIDGLGDERVADEAAEMIQSTYGPEAIAALESAGPSGGRRVAELLAKIRRR